MKRITVTVLLSLVMLCACGSAAQPAADSPTQPPAATRTPASPTPAPTEAPGEAPTEAPAGTPAEAPTEAPTEAASVSAPNNGIPDWWGEYVSRDTNSAIIISNVDTRSFLFVFTNLRNGEAIYDGAAPFDPDDPYSASYDDFTFRLSADGLSIDVAVPESGEWAHLNGVYEMAEDGGGGEAVVTLFADFSAGAPDVEPLFTEMTLPIFGNATDSSFAHQIADALSDWTGLSFDINGITLGDDSITADWAASSTLIAGLDDREQKDEFHFFDAVSLNWFMMDSMARTLKFNFGVSTVYYSADGGPVTFTNPEDMAASGLPVLPVDQSYEGSAFFAAHAGNMGDTADESEYHTEKLEAITGLNAYLVDIFTATSTMQIVLFTPVPPILLLPNKKPRNEYYSQPGKAAPGK